METNKNEESIYSLFLKNKDKFKWFVDKHFGKDVMGILESAAKQNDPLLKSYLNTIWYNLPDNTFNIVENPEGWTEFIELIELVEMA